MLLYIYRKIGISLLIQNHYDSKGERIKIVQYQLSRVDMQKPKIGFIGLGLMGSAMVERLQSLGYELIVKVNRNRQKIEEAASRGAVESVSAKQMAEQVEIVMFCVDNSQSVESNIYGDAGVLSGVKAGTIVIDFGTSLPTSTLKIAKDLAEKGAFYLDCPLGRTPAHAKDGKLNIMGAGEEEVFNQVKPVLDDLGENVFLSRFVKYWEQIKTPEQFFCDDNSLCHGRGLRDGRCGRGSPR